MNANFVQALGQKLVVFQVGLLAWAEQWLRKYPWRAANRSAYEVLLAELLLKRTTATAAAKVYETFLRTFPSLRAIAEATEEQLADGLSKVGLQRQRAKAMKALALYLVQVESGEVPGDLTRLLAVPGLGDYSARAILSFGFDIPVAVVDANVERVLGRVFRDVLPRRPSRHLLQELADGLVPYDSHRNYNLGLLDLGALVCRYVEPLCEGCPLNSCCDYYRRNKGRLVKEEPGRYETVTGVKLREVRKQKGFPLTKLARLSGVSKLTIIRIESGQTSPKRETLDKLAAALGIDPSQLQ